MIDYLKQGRTINGAYNAGELMRLIVRQEITRKRQGKLTQGVLLLQDNAPVHTSQVVMTITTECGLEILPHPPFLLIWHLLTFYLFPKLVRSMEAMKAS